MKQTAVEWLWDKLLKAEFINDPEELLNQAKEMEKEQIEHFYKQGHLYSGCPYGLEEVYNKTFKSE